VALNPQRRRRPEDLRFLQRGEGSCVGRYRVVAKPSLLHARSLARLNNAVLRDDAVELAR
jgi:hypothetical protein